jgi:hypothetical protein
LPTQGVQAQVGSDYLSFLDIYSGLYFLVSAQVQVRVRSDCTSLFCLLLRYRVQVRVGSDYSSLFGPLFCLYLGILPGCGVQVVQVENKLPTSGKKVHLREHSVHFREHSVHFREHSANLREQSVHFREHSANFRHSNLIHRLHSRSAPAQTQTPPRDRPPVAAEAFLFRFVLLSIGAVGAGWLHIFISHTLMRIDNSHKRGYSQGLIGDRPLAH